MPTIDEMSNAWWRKITKKSKGKPLPVIILQTRTLSTAVEILTSIQEIPFEKLSMSLYFYCHDVGMKEFTRAYEAQLELAGADPEKFALGLHQFFNKMANTIQKQNLYDNFFEFYYRCVKLRLQNENENVNTTVSTAYQNLLVQQMEYLRPSKFDFRTFIAGRKTTGEIITREDPFPLQERGGVHGGPARRHRRPAGKGAREQRPRAGERILRQVYRGSRLQFR